MLRTICRVGLRSASAAPRLLCLIGLIGFAMQSRADERQCGPLDTPNQYGPFDYRKRASLTSEFRLVESAHFTRDVQTLTRGSTGSVGADLDYTLRAIPNHHIALRTMLRYYTEKLPTPRPPMMYSAACYFDRAARLAPDDPIVWILRGSYALEVNETEEAVGHFARANSLAPANAEVQYNLGLMSLRLNKPADALRHAQIAYRGGYPLPGLRQRLQALGVWTESAEQPAAP